MKRRKPREDQPVTLEQIEDRLNNTLLASALALKVLRGIRKPTSQLINELLEIEFQVGHFVGDAMKIHLGKAQSMNLKGTLANALSTIPLGGLQKEASLKNESEIPNKKRKQLSQKKIKRKKIRKSL